MLAEIRMRTKQVTDGEAEMLEYLASGELHRLEDGWLIEYTESLPEMGGEIHNRIVCSDTEARVYREGAGAAEICYRPGHSHMCLYQTPAGALDLVFSTRMLQLKEKDGGICLHLEYALCSGEVLLSDCELDVEVLIPGTDQ